jgi:hypothetical protein
MIRQARGPLDVTVSQHLEGIRVSSWLTSYFRHKHEPMAVDVKPEDVIARLHEAGVKCVLMGTHALNTWRSEVRGTQDVDVLVRKKDIRKAVKALHEAYPTLTVNDFPVVTRLSDPVTEKGVIDVMKPTQSVYHLIFRHTIPIGDTHEIPDLEMCLASKFAAMVSPHRRPDKKMVDGGDFINVVHHNRSAISLRKLQRLADKVYPNGGAGILRMIEDIDAGRTLQL